MQSGFSVHPKASQSFANGAAKESPIIFSGDMCGLKSPVNEEN